VSGREAFAAEYGIDDALLARFGIYADALMQAQSQMNLVGPATLADIWSRHFADSAQLLPLGVVGPWLDLGAGAGFPGMVLALLGARVDLVEATGKKANFLEETAAQLGLGDRVRVHHARAELMVPFPAANITARALAILPKLFDWGVRFAAQDTRWVLPKGARVEAELVEARADWAFDAVLVPSRTSDEGRIVIATDVARKGRDAARDRQSKGRRR
jgi:16S rRNA (guanine527-N7)-methyltransferase